MNAMHNPLKRNPPLAPSMRGKRITLAVAISLVGAIVLPVACSSPSWGVPNAPLRETLPVRAGTVLTFTGQQVGPAYVPDKYCTAGAVTQWNSALARLTQYVAAIRYVVTAAHCASRVGQTVQVAGESVGRVYWISHESDLALVRVEPTQIRRLQCSGSVSGAPHCTIVSHVVPRAVGQIVFGSSGVPNSGVLTVTGSSIPADREYFCMSGIATGTNCDQINTTVPFGLQLPPHQQIAYSTGVVIRNGDSGAPVFSRSGKLYGILSASYNDAFERYSTYVPIGRFFDEQPAYGLVLG